MGKAGKLRKKRKNDEFVNSCVVDCDIDSDFSEDEEDSHTHKKSNGNVKLNIAKSVFDMLSQRLDMYMDARMKPLRRALYPIVQFQQGHFFEPNCLDMAVPSDVVANQVLSPENIGVAIQLVTHYAAHPDEYLSAEKKHLRKAVHPLVLFHTRQTRANKKAGSQSNVELTTDGQPIASFVDETSLTSRISGYFRTRQWSKVLDGLQKMYVDDNEVPKLGSVQRWVRECDVSAEEHGNAESYASSTRNSTSTDAQEVFDIKQISLQLLYAVMKVMVHKLDKTVAAPAVDATQGVKCPLDINDSSNPAECVYLPEFTLPDPEASRKVFTPAIAKLVLAEDLQSGIFRPLGAVPVLGPLEDFKARIGVISHVPGPLRRPPVPHDLNIYTTTPHTIAFESEDVRTVAASRHDVPGVPGAFVLRNALSVAECCQLILAAEHMQYAPDTVDGIEGVVWLGDETIMDPIFERLRHLMPQTLSTHELRGVNARLRLFRYSPGAVYRPHIDGAWPGSGVLPSGEYTDDAFNGTQHTKLTFLVYLSDGFTGGATTFFLPKICSGEPGERSTAVNVNTIEARSVRPMQGSVLCFPHGSALGSLVHEGSAVHEGTKYVIRTDVRYSV